MGNLCINSHNITYVYHFLFKSGGTLKPSQYVFITIHKDKFIYYIENNVYKGSIVTCNDPFYLYYTILFPCVCLPLHLFRGVGSKKRWIKRVKANERFRTDYLVTKGTVINLGN